MKLPELGALERKRKLAMAGTYSFQTIPLRKMHGDAFWRMGESLMSPTTVAFVSLRAFCVIVRAWFSFAVVVVAIYVFVGFSVCRLYELVFTLFACALRFALSS